MRVATRPTITEIRAPKMTRLNISRPRLSVPKKNFADGGTITKSVNISFMPCGARTLAKMAMSSMIKVITAPIVPSGFSLISRITTSAILERFFILVLLFAIFFATP